MDIKVKIHTLRTEGGRLADASVSLDGCFAIRGVRIVSGSKGPFVEIGRASCRERVSSPG